MAGQAAEGVQIGTRLSTVSGSMATRRKDHSGGYKGEDEEHCRSIEEFQEEGRTLLGR